MSQTIRIAPKAIAKNQQRSCVVDFLTGPVRSRQEHDMRNLLYLTASFAELLREGAAGPVSERQKEFLGHILDCAARGQKLLTLPVLPAAAGPHAPSAGRASRAA